MPSLSANELTLTIKAVDQASAVLKRVQDSVDGVSKESERGAGAVQKLKNNWAPITAVAAASSTAFMMLGGSIVQSVGDFQQGMSVFQQISGATTEQMTRVQAKAKELGNDIRLPGVSAKTAADAMTELAKAGLSVNDTLDASRGVLALAKAGQLDTAQAAEITANALLAFNLRGTEATRVADLLAAAANASSSDVSGIGQSMAQVSAVAAQTKRPVEDVVTQIALLANQGIKGSDAGTSLKTMLMALTPKSKEAAQAMAALGLNAYDAEGKMKSTRDIIGMYSEKLAKMTDEQRDQTLQTIFGSDAMRAASILIRGGTAEYDKMAASVTKAGAAQENAASYSNGLKGNIEAINSSLETISLTIGEKVLPFIQQVTGAVAGWISQNEELATALAIGLVVFLGLGAILTSIAAVIALIGSGAALVFVGIAAAVAACAALVVTYWGPISGFFSALWTGITTAFGIAVAWISEKADYLKGHFWETVGFIIGFFATLPIKLPFFVIAAIVAIFNYLASVNWGEVWQRITDTFGAAWERIKDAGLQALLYLIRLDWGSIGKSVGNAIVGALEGAINGALAGIPGAPKVKIPRFASGTNFAPGGTAWVGERGPELVNLPRGSQVYTNSQSRQMLSAGRGGEVVIHVAHQEIRNENDAKSWARQLGVRVNP